MNRKLKPNLSIGPALLVAIATSSVGWTVPALAVDVEQTGQAELEALAEAGLALVAENAQTELAVETSVSGVSISETVVAKTSVAEAAVAEASEVASNVSAPASETPDFSEFQDVTAETSEVLALESEALESEVLESEGPTENVEEASGQLQVLSQLPPVPEQPPENSSPESLPSLEEGQEALPPQAEPSAPTQPQAPTAQPQPGTQPDEAQSDNQPRVLVAEVGIEGIEGSEEQFLEDEIYRVIRTQPGQATTSTQLQADLNSIFGTGYFANVNFRPEDTPLGVRVVFIVEPNPILQSVSAENTQVLTAEKIDEVFADQYGKILNFRDLQQGVQDINRFYQDQGFVLAQVVDATQISADGRVQLEIAEGIVDSVTVRFLDADGNPTDEVGEPIQGRTKPYVVTREFSLKPGDVFNRQQAESDLQRVFGLGIFQDVRLSLDPSPDDPRRVVVVANVIEARTGNIGATGGLSSSNGIFGSISLGRDNFRGRNQKLRSEVTLGQRDFLFDVGFTDPWIKGDPYRTGYTVNGFRRRSQSLIFSGGDTDIDLPNGDTPRILRLGGALRFSRPLSRNVFEPAEWNASAGLQYQRVIIRDDDGDASPQDELGNDLTFSGEDADDLLTLQFGLARDRRNNRVQPTRGSISRFNVDQSVPVGSGSILFNRLRANHSQFIPIRFLRLTQGCRGEAPTASDCPQTLAFNVQAGTVLGDLPPYEAFSIGGSNSVRGFSEGEVGSGRSFLQATAEYRFPVFSIVGGALFADFGTDLGSGDSVPGDPAGVRDKPGSGYGLGLGVRVRSPLGPIRADFTVVSNDGDQRFQFGIGERF